MSMARNARTRMQRTVAFTINDRVYTKIPYTTVTVNQPTGAFTYPGDSTVTVNWTGLYLINMSLEIANPVNTWEFVGLLVYVNGAFYEWVRGGGGLNSIDTRFNGSVYARLNKGDNLAGWVYQAQNPGDDLINNADAGDGMTYFDVTFIDKV